MAGATRLPSGSLRPAIIRSSCCSRIDGLGLLKFKIIDLQFPNCHLIH